MYVRLYARRYVRGDKSPYRHGRAKVQGEMAAIVDGMSSALPSILSPSIKPFALTGNKEHDTGLDTSIVAYHNWVASLFWRQKKYVDRGVAIIDSPEGACELAEWLKRRGAVK